MNDKIFHTTHDALKAHHARTGYTYMVQDRGIVTVKLCYVPRPGSRDDGCKTQRTAILVFFPRWEWIGADRDIHSRLGTEREKESNRVKKPSAEEKSVERTGERVKEERRAGGCD